MPSPTQPPKKKVMFIKRDTGSSPTIERDKRATLPEKEERDAELMSGLHIEGGHCVLTKALMEAGIANIDLNGTNNNKKKKKTPKRVR